MLIAGTVHGSSSTNSQAELPAEDSGHETSSTLFEDDLLNTFACLCHPVAPLGRLHRVGIRAPYISPCDLVAVAFREPAQGEEPGTAGEVGVSLGEVATGAGERPRVARTGVGESERLIVETGFLGCGEPFRLLSRRRRREVGQELAGVFVRVLLGDRLEGRQVRAAAVRPQA